MGVLRLLLALAVLNRHLESPAPDFIVGGSAVFVFYMISGFYMSLVISEKYGTLASGIAKFYGNRALRLYPVYFVVLIAGEFVHWHFLDYGAAWSLNQLLIFPHALVANLTLNPANANSLMLGQMYTVALEIMFYAIAPFLVRRRLWLLIALFAVAAGYHATIWYSGAEIRAWQYDFFPAVMLYFLAGVLAYRFYTLVRTWRYPGWAGYAVLPLIIIAARLTVLTDYGTIWTNNIPVFVFYAMCAAAIPFLFIATKDSETDRFIGDMSYPLYVVHAPIADLILAIPGLKGTLGGTTVVVATSMLCALGLAVVVDRPIERLRAAVARRGAVAERLRTAGAYP